MTKRHAQTRCGFTLTEIAIVLGIMGLILGAIWTASATVRRNQHITHANQTIMQLVQGTRTMYASSSTTGYTVATDITGLLTTAGATPSDLGTSNALTGPFSSGATAVSATPDGAGFLLAMSGMSQSECISLMTTVAGQSRDPTLWAAEAVPWVASAGILVPGTITTIGMPAGFTGVQPPIIAVTPAMAGGLLTAPLV